MADSPPTRAQGSAPDLNPEHRRAICDEIGAQLRGTLADERLEGMVERLAELDGDAPSPAPHRQSDAPSRPLWKFVSALARVLRRGS